MLACSESAIYLCESLAVDVTNCPRWRALKQHEVGSLTVWSSGSLEWTPVGHGAGSRAGDELPCSSWNLRPSVRLGLDSALKSPPFLHQVSHPSRCLSTFSPPSHQDPCDDAQGCPGNQRIFGLKMLNLITPAKCTLQVRYICGVWEGLGCRCLWGTPFSSLPHCNRKISD